MPNAKYNILSTKTLWPEILQEAARHGLAVKEQAFIDIAPAVTEATARRIAEILTQGGVMVFTSPNAVKAAAAAVPFSFWNNTRPYFSDMAPDRYMYCLAGATRQAVEEHMSNILVAGTAANSKELAEKIIADNTAGPVVFFCGNIRRNELPELLQQHNIQVEEHVVYHTTETPAVLKETFDGILFLSPSSVRSFFSANNLPKHTVCFAIGSTTAAALEEVTDNRVITSPSPSASALLGSAIFYFDNINCYE